MSWLAYALILDALKRAVAEALERKRKLGQYAVIWREGCVARIGPMRQTCLVPRQSSAGNEYPYRLIDSVVVPVGEKVARAWYHSDTSIWVVACDGKPVG